MIHTNEEFLEQIFIQIKDQDHLCCVEQAANDWIKIIHKEEHAEFISGILAKADMDGKNTLDTYMKILSLGLLIGSVCALGSVDIMTEKIDEKLKSSFGDFLRNAPWPTKKPKETM